MEPHDPAEQQLRWAVKRELRKRLRGVRGALTAAAVRQRSEAIVARVQRLPGWAGARSLALFWPIEGRNEVDLRPLIEPARAAGKRLAFPGTDADGAEICLRWLDPGASLEAGPMGYDEPPAGSPRAEAVDLVLVPALAVDPSGHRIGYGRGFYDRLLARLAPAESAVVAYDFQLLAEVPATATDTPVGWIVTDRRHFRAGSDPGMNPIEVLGAEAEPPAAAPAAAEPGVKVIGRPPRGG